MQICILFVSKNVSRILFQNLMCEVDDEMATQILQEKKPNPQSPEAKARVDARSFALEGMQIMVAPDNRLSKSDESYVKKGMSFNSKELGTIDILHICAQKYAVLERHSRQLKLGVPIKRF